jgi:hypothetical protein
VALWVIWGFIERNYEVGRQDVSDFGALDASHPVPYNIILSITGALSIVLAYGLYKALAPGIGALAGSALVAVFGAGDFLDGLLREDCSPTGNAVCRKALDAGDLSWHHQAHDLESLFTIASVVLAPLVLGFVFRGRVDWRRLAWYSFASSAGVLSSVVAYAALQYHDGAGLVQRLVIVFAVTWVAVVSWRLTQVARRAG